MKVKGNLDVEGSLTEQGQPVAGSITFTDGKTSKQATTLHFSGNEFYLSGSTSGGAVANLNRDTYIQFKVDNPPETRNGKSDEFDRPDGTAIDETLWTVWEPTSNTLLTNPPTILSGAMRLQTASTPVADAWAGTYQLVSGQDFQITSKVSISTGPSLNGSQGGIFIGGVDFASNEATAEFVALSLKVPTGSAPLQTALVFEHYTAYSDAAPTVNLSHTLDYPGDTMYLRLSYNNSNGQVRAWISNGGLAWRSIGTDTSFAAGEGSAGGFGVRAEQSPTGGTLTNYVEFIRFEDFNDGAQATKGRYVRAENAAESETSGQ